MKIPAILPIAMLAAAIVFASPVQRVAHAQAPTCLDQGMVVDPNDANACVACPDGEVPAPADVDATNMMCVAAPVDSGMSSSGSDASKTTGAQRLRLGRGF